jgi:hypothetical protein
MTPEAIKRRTQILDRCAEEREEHLKEIERNPSLKRSIEQTWDVALNRKRSK